MANTYVIANKRRKIKYNKDTNTKPFYAIPVDDCNKVLQKIDGNHGNAIKLMIYLMGNKENFTPAVKRILDCTGMPKNSYYSARDYLIEIGLLTYTDTEIIINV